MMADIKLILTSPSSTVSTLTAPPRRLSFPTLIKPIRQRRDSKRETSTEAKQPISLPTQPHRSALYHLHTLLLFTYSDLKNILLPQILLALAIAISCSQPEKASSTSESSTRLIISHLPQALAWVWLHLLLFCTSNQSLPSSLAEDTGNKPWRPLPSKRLTNTQARQLLLAVSILAPLTSLFVGGFWESFLFQALTYLNNDLAWGDKSAVKRNLINALGYTTFALGAISVLFHGSENLVLGQQGYTWLGFLALVILTTGHCQDLEDREGDEAKGRSTIPIVLGDEAARWSLIVPMALWTLLAPRFWGCEFQGSIFLFAIGAVVIKRLIVGDEESYKVTFRLWNCWIVALYLLPLCKHGL